ncbi:hypothetical protein [Pseudotabrizicola sp. L79]|uniref:hypothetical protein n=1 Tax=Pseudotabrizicola sp. L79 TaxID=3118402 RepID=UPI002F9288F1
MTGKTPGAITALKQYARLESTGLWRDRPEAQRREVIVAFREASLVLSDPRSEQPLSHWSLPAVQRLNPGQLPALFGPDDSGTETLEVSDRDMIAALEQVRGALESRRPKPGRLRGFLWGSGTVLVLAAAIFWLPEALVKHTASVLPAATRASIGQATLADVQRLTGSPCTAPLGSFALTALSDKLFGPHRAQIHIMRDGVEKSAHLPGGVILIDRQVVEQANGPETLAGLALAERLRAETTDPMLAVLRYAGLVATFRLLTTGIMPDSALQGYGEAVLKSDPAPVDTQALLARFGSAGVSSAPYAYALDPSGETVLPLIEADPMRGLVPQALMSDGDWVTLQDICSSG